MKKKYPTTLRAIFITGTWLASLGMIIFDVEHFPFTPLIVFNVGLIAYLANPETARKEITLKEFFPRLLIFIAAIGGIIFLFIQFPVLAKQPTQPYRSIGYALVILPFTTKVWLEWYKANRNAG